jgi:hypothetical protein
MLNFIINQISVESLDAIGKVSAKYGIRLLIDLISSFVLIRLIYYHYYKSKDLLFTYFIFNIVIFTISFLLNRVEISMGAAFGLFAVFSMLRYKTEEVSIKDMTYLFLTIAIGIISAVTKIKGAEDIHEFIFLVGINSVILFITFLLESNLLMKQEAFKTVNYEKIELIHPDRNEEFLADLKARTGINIHRATIQKIDFLRDSAQVRIYYYE